MFKSNISIWSWIFLGLVYKYDLWRNFNNEEDTWLYMFLYNKHHRSTLDRRYISDDYYGNEVIYTQGLFNCPVIHNFKYNNINLGTDDYPWFLRQSRGWLRNNITGSWANEHITFTFWFENEGDAEVFKKWLSND